MKRLASVRFGIAYGIVVLLVALLTACEIRQPPEVDGSYVDKNGETYFIVHENHIDFAKNNVLEVRLSDNEWFVLYDSSYGAPDPRHEQERGYGEWFVNGERIPVLYYNEEYGDLAYEHYLHDDILIRYDGYSGEDKRPFPSGSIFIAKIINNPDTPGLKWCIDGNYVYSPKFSEEVTEVVYRQYKRTDILEYAPYISLLDSPYYHIPDDLTVRYREKNLDFYFDGRTGEGIWTVGETQYPVLCTFDIGRFTFTMCYNTEDEKKGQVILTAEGTRLGEVNSAYRITDYADEFTGDPSAELVLLKNYVSPSDAWTDFTSAEDGTHMVFRCEKGNFSYDATAKEGMWITNGTEVSIRIEFDPLRYEMNVFDVSTGEKILNAKGYLQDDHTAVFTEYEGSMFYKNSLGDIVIEKIITE